MVGEELSRRRILVWLQERRINSAELFRRTMIEFCEQDEDLTYLRVKKKLVATFGIQCFTEHKEVGRVDRDPPIPHPTPHNPALSLRLSLRRLLEQTTSSAVG